MAGGFILFIMKIFIIICLAFAACTKEKVPPICGNIIYVSKDTIAVRYPTDKVFDIPIKDNHYNIGDLYCK